MVNSINSNLAALLFSQTSSTPTGVSADLLTSWATAKAGLSAATTQAAQGAADPNAPIEPVWTPGLSPSDSALVDSALGGKAFFDTNAQLYSALGANGDYRKLFALYSGLSTLQALAGRAQDKTLSSRALDANTAAFSRGLSELQAFFSAQKFDDVRLAQGDRVDSAQATLAIPVSSEDYTTPVIQSGSLASTVSGLDPNAVFDVVATSSTGGQRTVTIDLSQMGSMPRSLGAVVSFINSKLSAAGVQSRLATVDQTPKTTTVVLGGKGVQVAYVGPRKYALQVDVRGGETISLKPQNAKPALYVVGDVGGGARLIKLQDAGGAAGQPQTLDRPQATVNAVGNALATGWLDSAAPVFEQRTNAMVSDTSNNFETALRAPGEAVLTLQTADGRTLSVSTAWRSDDIEAWRALSGENSDQAMLGDLAQRLTQLLHEQGVAAGVDVWQNGTQGGLSILTGDQITATSLTVSGRQAGLTAVDPPNMTGGLRDGVFAREFAAGNVAASNAVFTGEQTFSFATAAGSVAIAIDTGDTGVDGATLMARLNEQLRAKGIAAAASLTDNGAGGVALQIDAMHDVLSAAATINGDAYALDLQPPGAWANGGLPVTSPGSTLGDAIRSYDVAGGSPLATNPGALAVDVVVATPEGNKTVSVAVTASERANDPDSNGQWSTAFQARLDAALNSAGVYVSAGGGDLTHWSVAEGSGQRLASVSVNGNALTLQGEDPAYGVGGAFSAERSFTGAQVAAATSDPIAALGSDRTASITFSTIWGDKTVSATLDPSDDPTLENAALRLNQALAAAGYDLGVAAADLGGGAGLRAITGASHSIVNVSDISIGGVSGPATLDPVDATSHADDPPGAAAVADRASRGAAVTLTTPGTSAFSAPSTGSAGWFPGRSFDVSIGGGVKVATARAVAAGADGSVYVLANLNGDTATSAIKGAQDVGLFKYDSAGKLAFSEMLGATQSADGLALAVASDGKVAVAGSVTGALSGTSAKGGADSFVTVFDASGKEMWTARRAATADDQVNTVAFAPNGTLVVAGKTGSALPTQAGLGGADGYLRGYSMTGSELFTKQFGTSGDDSATALAVRDDGSGGVEIFTGGVENNRGVLRQFTYSASAGFAAGVTRDIGYFYKGAINAIAFDGSSLYAGGEIGADRLTLGASGRAAIAGQEGFVARLDADLSSTSLDRASYLGSAGNDSVKGLAVVDGEVYAAGVSGGVIAGQGASGAKRGFVARLDDAGAVGWLTTFNSAAGALAVNSMAVQADGVSALDALGLPSGRVAAKDFGPLASRSALRAGDELQIGAYGGRLTTVTIGANDSLSALASNINRALNGTGRAEIVTDASGQRIKITARDGAAIRIESGRDGRDALPALGLQPGVIAQDTTKAGAEKTFGLGLIGAELKLDTPANIANTKAEISAAVSIVRQAYEALLHPNAQPKSDAQKALDAKLAAAGAAPQYLTDRIANYKAALARLTGSSS